MKKPTPEIRHCEIFAKSLVQFKNIGFELKVDENQFELWRGEECYCVMGTLMELDSFFCGYTAGRDDANRKRSS